MRTVNHKISLFVQAHGMALLVLAALFLARLLAMYSLGVQYTLWSDDTSYLRSGIYFAQHGVLTMHEEYPSAQIMPGMTWLIALFSLLFGEGRGLWMALKLLWSAMGTLTGWYLYRCVGLFAPKWCGVAAMFCLFRADFLWMDNLILTETPFLLALTAMVYYTFRMGRFQDWHSFIGCLAAYLAGLLLKANIALYPLFALAYLLCTQYDRKLLMKQCGIVAAAVLVFLIPWTARNYRQFHAFIPLTYGAGNPTLQGTYQGRGYPADEELDYETNVEQPARQRYAAYYQEDGTVQPRYQRYVSLGKDAIKAAYRQKVWWDRDWTAFLYSYLIAKPWQTMNELFYWQRVLDVPGDRMALVQRMDLYFCALALAASVILKKKRLPMLFLAGTYLANVYIYSMTFAFGRYNASLMGLRFLMVGIGLSLVVQLARRGVESVEQFERDER